MKRKSPVEKHFDKIAVNYDIYTKKRNLHYSTLKELLGNLIPPKKRVLEIGCGTGDLLASIKPRYGYGMDISSRMISISKIKYQKSNNLYFSTSWPQEKFDFIFMSDVIEHLEYPNEIFRRILKSMGPKSIFINIMMNPVWSPVENVYSWLGLKMPEGPHNRIKYVDLRFMIEDLGMKITKHDYKLLIPINIPFITNFANKYLERFFRKYAFIEYFTATKS